MSYVRTAELFIMKKAIVILILLFVAPAKSQNLNKKNMEQSIHSFTVEKIDGSSFDLSSLKGKKVMIVNTASECGLTPQYEKLQALYDKYRQQGFIIIGFPANNFGAQEPGSNGQIATFCKSNYNITFPMMAKISVKGKDMHPLYQFLTQKSKNGLQDSEVSWNFQKYLIDQNGKLVKVIKPTVQPDDAEIVSWIKS